MIEDKKIKVHFPGEVALVDECDVLVVGGGPGGIGAAVAAGRCGAKTVLSEKGGFLGGMASQGEVSPFMPNQLSGEDLDRGIFTEWRQAINRLDRVAESNVFDPLSARFAADALCREAGVRVLFHHFFSHAEVENGGIRAVVFWGKGGPVAIKAKLVIDASGDGDVAQSAGCDFEYGNDSGNCQPMSVCFKLRLDPQDYPPEHRGKKAIELSDMIVPQFQAAYQKARKEGRTSNVREDILTFPTVWDDVIHFNSTRIIGKSAVNARDLSDAEIEGRKQVLELIEILRELPLYRHCRLFSLATHIGIRESRRVLGRAYVKREDFEQARKFPDAIARVTYNIDIHSPDGEGTELIELTPGDWYEIPYGCIVPQSIRNLLMACRAISADHAIHSSLRIMAPVCSIGQAAGTAAALCAKRNVPPEELDGTELRSLLKSQGRHL